MKHVFVILAIGLFAANSMAQKPEPIYGQARHHKSIAYYKEQAAAWKKMVSDHPQDPNAWYNYYYVNRNLMFCDTLDKRTMAERQKFMNKIVDDMEQQIPNSYEYNLCRWITGGGDMAKLPYLKKAAELGPERTEHLDYMINIGEITRNMKDRDTYSQRKFETGQFSGGIINYNYNVLVGLEPNAILITCGDNDTYPIWLLQAQGIRKDVNVINLSLVYIDEYRDRLFSELGIEKWQSVADAEAGKTEADHERFRTGIVKHITVNKKKCPVYIALTATEHYTKTIEQNLYLTGLAYLYSEASVDNVAFLKKNMEQRFALDYLDKNFYQDISPDMVKMINGNYLVPMVTLYDHYRLAGDTQKEEWIKGRLLAISSNTEYEAEIKKRLARN